MKIKKPSIYFVVPIIIITFILAGMGILYFKVQEHQPPDTSHLLVKISTSGGLCPDGPCYKAKEIEKEGNEELEVLINNTYFNQERAVPYTKLCPTAYDGQSVTYTFYTDHGEEVIDSCETEINYESELFQTLNNYTIL